MKRNEWEFHYTAQDLKAAAEKKVEHHQERLAFWKGKRDEVMATIKEKGLVINESVAANTGYFSKTGRQPSIDIDDALEQDMKECMFKCLEHETRLREYEGWVEVMAAQGIHSSFNLNNDDWLFFFSTR